MKDRTSRLSQPGMQHGYSIKPEDRTQQWWQMCARAYAIKTETGYWPTRKHAECGAWITQTCNALRDMHGRGGISEAKHRVLSSERLSELRRIGFPMDGRLPNNVLHKDDGPLQRVLQAIADGQKPSRTDRDIISRRKLDMKTYEYLVSHGVKL